MSTLTSNATTNLNQLSPAALGPSDDEPVYAGMRLSTWVKVVSLAALFAMLFWSNLRRLWDKTNPINGADPNWAHAIFVPLIGLYYLYINRDTLLAARVRTTWEGLGITIFGIAFFVYGIWPGSNDWFKDIGMVVTLFGMVTFLCGWEVMKTAWFPIVFLVCALPWPGLFYSKLAGPLQKLAAMVAVRVLNIAGVGSLQFGNKIFISGKDGIQTLNVAEACSGLRSLMTFVSIAAAIAFLSARPLWQRLIMVASAIPIAISCNSMRVAAQGFINHNYGTQWSESFAHGFVGLMMMIPAFFLILLVGWVLQNLFVEEVDDKAALRLKARGAIRRGPSPAAFQVVAAERPLAAVSGAAPAARRVAGGLAIPAASQRQVTAGPAPGAPANAGQVRSAGSAPPRVAPPTAGPARTAATTGIAAPTAGPARVAAPGPSRTAPSSAPVKPITAPRSPAPGGQVAPARAPGAPLGASRPPPTAPVAGAVGEGAVPPAAPKPPAAPRPPAATVPVAAKTPAPASTKTQPSAPAPRPPVPQRKEAP
ncbi:MAG TPA: exosortase [Tepidisphaeraceae bacterium]|nr:exosortase [Tepidisphaeraceae bacterium]